MSQAVLRSQHEDTFLRNATVLQAVRTFARDRHDDAALNGLPDDVQAVLVGPDGIAAVNPWLRAFRQPLDLYDRFRVDLLDGVAFTDDDLEKMAEATSKALGSLVDTVRRGRRVPWGPARQ